MNAIDLTSLENAPMEELLKDGLDRWKLELHFNGRLVAGDIVAAIAAGRREVATTTGVPERDVEPRKLVVAAYHAEEQAIYVAMEYTLPVSGQGGVPRSAFTEHRIAKGEAFGQAEMTRISLGTSAKVLELLDALDLTKEIWLPYST